jgi:hypothetical protein
MTNSDYFYCQTIKRLIGEPNQQNKPMFVFTVESNCTERTSTLKLQVVASLYYWYNCLVTRERLNQHQPKHIISENLQADG